MQTTNIKLRGISGVRGSSADRFAKIRKRRDEAILRVCPDRLNGCRIEDVRNVLVINAASRSGSSFLHHVLSGSPDVVSLNGEGIAFEKLHSLGEIGSVRDSDDFAFKDPTCDRTLAAVARDMLLDSGMPFDPRSSAPFPRDEFLADSVCRLLLQYPEVDLDVNLVQSSCAYVLERYLDGACEFSPFSYWFKLLAKLRREYSDMDPVHYDLGRRGPARTEILRPPFSQYVLEEPPFVVPAPRRLPSPAVLAGKTLLLKSTSFCYHLPLVRRMFPKARFKFIVLVRNPAASINGLMDGWLSGGFYSRNLHSLGGLAISGYSRASRSWTRRWWKFDLPPGWHALRNQRLENVCAFQWRSANERIFQDLQKGLLEEYLVMRYESFLDPVLLRAEIRRALDFAGLNPGSFDDSRSQTTVMSVSPPAAGKWLARRGAIAPVLANPEIRKIAGACGYDPDDWERWP